MPNDDCQTCWPTDHGWCFLILLKRKHNVSVTSKIPINDVSLNNLLKFCWTERRATLSHSGVSHIAEALVEGSS